MLQNHGVDERAKCRLGKTAKDYAPEMSQRYWDDWQLIGRNGYEYLGHNGYGWGGPMRKVSLALITCGPTCAVHMHGEIQLRANSLIMYGQISHI